MATEARYAIPETPEAPANSPSRGHMLTLEELAEFIDAIEYDDAPAAVANSADYDPDY